MVYTCLHVLKSVCAFIDLIENYKKTKNIFTTKEYASL